MDTEGYQVSIPGNIQPDVIHSSRAVPNLVFHCLKQPMYCCDTGQSHVWLYTPVYDWLLDARSSDFQGPWSYSQTEQTG